MAFVSRSCPAAACFLLLALSQAVILGAAAMTCDKTALAPCATGITMGIPSSECYAKLKEMQHCYCNFLKDPAVRHLIETPEAKKMIATCGVTLPVQCNTS